MQNYKKYLILIIIYLFLLCPQSANAGNVSSGVDKAINLTAKATYYVTKYTLKTGVFLVKKTGKGITMVSKSIIKGTKDAFKPNSTIKPVNNRNYNKHEENALPPPPPFVE
ncbi:MAG TPA: hypothetical protein P5556_09900 [Candidatus Gastranaerophilales bacterium]|nr:hypothetical protein [Candidatus Gastranaerophilales bacterium]